ncbi:MAG TPA: hypothetical protein VGM39_12675 [Kofleriaceae bacterium]
MAHPLWIVRMVEEQDHRDVEGRLLRESRAPAECIRPGEIEYKPCPYAGSRATTPPLPMNVSALRATSAHWDDIINALSFMRVTYARARGLTSFELMDIWRISQLGSSLPYLFMFGLDEPCPAYAANLAKATLGLGMWGQRVFQKVVSERWKPPAMTAQSILALAEDNKTLVGATEACSGPEKMLLRFFEALIDTPPELTSPEMTRLEELRDNAFAFGTYYLQWKLATHVVFHARRFVYADLLVAHPNNAQLRDQLDARHSEPADFFTPSPTDMHALPVSQRQWWLAKFAMNFVAFAPDTVDRLLAIRVMEAVRSPTIKDPFERWAALDEIFGKILLICENGLRRAVDAPAIEGPISADDRDRLVRIPARWLMARLGSDPR